MSTAVFNKTYSNHNYCHNFKSKNVSRDTKLRIYKTLIRPVLLYACEAWTLTKDDERILSTFCDGFLVLRKRNFELYNLLQEPNVIATTKAHRLWWMGHVERMDDKRLPKRIINSKNNYQKLRSERPRGKTKMD